MRRPKGNAADQQFRFVCGSPASCKDRRLAAALRIDPSANMAR
jgi:hypothetical protein